MSDSIKETEEEEKKEELLHKDLSRVSQLLCESREECEDLGQKYQDLTERMEALLQLEDGSGDKARELTTADQYQRRLAELLAFQEQQAAIVKQLQDKIEQFRSKVEEEGLDLPPPPTPSPLDSLKDPSGRGVVGGGNPRPDDQRLEALSQLNLSLRDQLEVSTEANRALTEDIYRLAQEWQRTRAQLEEREVQWSQEDSVESGRAASLWAQVARFRRDFVQLRTELEGNLATLRRELSATSHRLVSACLLLSQRQASGTWSSQELSGLHAKFEKEKAVLLKQIDELSTKDNKKSRILQNKDRALENLTTMLHNLELNLPSQSELSRHQPDTVGFLQRALHEVLQAIQQQAESSGWLGELMEQLRQQGLSLNIADGSTFNILTQLTDGALAATNIALSRYQRSDQDLQVQLKMAREESRDLQRRAEESEERARKAQLHNVQQASQLDALRTELTLVQRGSGEISPDLLSQLTFLNLEVEKLNAENDKLTTLAAEFRSKVERAESDKQILRETVGSLNQKMEHSSRTISGLEDSKVHLEKEVRSLQELNRQQSLEKERLVQDKMDLSKQAQMVAGLLAELEQVQAESELLRGQLATAQSQSDSIQLDRDNLSLSLAQAQETCRQAVRERNEAEFKLRGAEAKITDLRNVLVSEESHRSQLTDSLRISESLSAQLQSSLDQADMDRADLRSQLAKMSQEKCLLLEEMEFHQAELQTAKDRLHASKLEESRLEVELSALQERLDSSLRVSAELSHTQDLLEDEREKSHALQRQLQKLAAQADEERDHHARARHDLTEKFNLLEKDYHQALSQLRQTHIQDLALIAQEKESMRKRLEAAHQEDMGQLQTDREELLSELSRLRKEHLHLEQEWETRLAYLQAEKKRADGQALREKQAFQDRLRAAEKQLEHQKQLAESSRLEQAKAWEVDKANLEAQAGRLREELQASQEGHQKQQADLTAKLAEVRDQRDEARNKVQTLHSQLAALGEVRDSLERELEDLRHQLLLVEQQRTGLQTQLAEVQRQLQREQSKAEAAQNSAEERLRVLEREVQSLQGQLSQSKQQVAGLEEARWKLGQSCSQLRGALREVEAARQDWKQQAGAARQQLTTQQLSLRQAEQESRDLSRLHQALEKTCSDLHSQVSSLRQQLMEADAGREAASKEAASQAERRLSAEQAMRELERCCQDSELQLSAAESRLRGLEVHISHLREGKQAAERQLTDFRTTLANSLGVEESALDPNRVRSTLQNLSSRLELSLHDSEDWKDRASRAQRQLEDAKEELQMESARSAHLQRLLGDLEDEKKDVELARSKASLLQQEKLVQAMEKERLQLEEKLASMEQSAASLESTRLKMQDKMAQMRRTEARLEREKTELQGEKMRLEGRCSQLEILVETTEAERHRLQLAAAEFETQTKVLKQEVDMLDQKVQQLEDANRSLQSMRDHLNASLLRTEEGETLLKDKVAGLNQSLSETTFSAQGLRDQLHQLRSEVSRCQRERSELQASLSQLRQDNRSLRDRVRHLQGELSAALAHQATLESRLINAQEAEQQARRAEQDAQARVQSEKLEKQALQHDLDAAMSRGTEASRQLERERSQLHKSLNKAERDRRKTEDLATQTIKESSSLNMTLAALENDNLQLQRRLQALQNQLEQGSGDKMLEVERLRTALSQAEQLLEVRERTHKGRTQALEQQVTSLKDQLILEQRRWQQSGAELAGLRSTLDRSLRSVGRNPDLLAEEARRLEAVLPSPILASTPRPRKSNRSLRS